MQCHIMERMDLNGLGFSGGLGVPYRARAVSLEAVSSPNILQPGHVLDGIVLTAGDVVLLTNQADIRRR